LYAGKLLHGFDLVVFFELIARPEFGPVQAWVWPAVDLAILFFLATMLLLPGVLLGYASDRRLPRGEFFRACGDNIWRFVRLFLLFALIAVPISAILGAAQNALVKAADQGSNERLPFLIQLAGMGITFLVLTAIRIWFDLAQIQVVVADQGKVRKSIVAALRGVKGYRIRLLASYVSIAILAGIVLVVGVWFWIRIVPAASVAAAFIVGQAILLLLLAARFWQRACAVAFYRDYMTAIIVERETIPSASLPVVALIDEGGPVPLPQT
jgi:hypothetical protein